jgi:hypothetical protein
VSRGKKCLVATVPGMAVVASGVTGFSMPHLRSAAAGAQGSGPALEVISFDLELEAVEIQPPGPFGPSHRPSDTKQSIFRALPQQLGLTLEAMQGTIDVLVIESAEQPTLMAVPALQGGTPRRRRVRWPAAGWQT